MSTKEVHWKLTVEEYAARDSPESWTSPLPTPTTLPTTPPTTPTLPTPPLPNLPLSLPTTLEVHPALNPENALQLDFSFPSDAFRKNPQLTDALLAEPACTPPRAALCVRIAAGAFKERLGIKHEPQGEPVTVGDVLTTIQKRLRSYDYGAAPQEAQPYKQRRIETVNGYREGRESRDRRQEAANVAAEREGNGRLVDHLLGNTLFAGLAVQLGQPDHCWQLQLKIPERYVYRE
ncbi:hypothetical protein C8R44DRAFT_885845 [Mycena epipterygia]|nr:hypothetical protein C8R44DRAFT_885845 [Mycena epipterygia]